MLILGVGGNKFQGEKEHGSVAARPSTVFGGCLPSPHLEEGCQSALWVTMGTRLVKRAFKYVLHCALFASRHHQPDI